ncbi:MAG: hypothetical protein WCA11_05960, partial [Terracidiphilus sp.]
MVCTGYSAAWISNLHGFRERSLVERMFWSVPLSLAISTIASVLIGKFLSLAAVVVFLMASTVLCIVLICWEARQLRRSGKHWNIGWSPFGGKASIMAVIWISVVVLSLVDFQSGEKLFVNISMLDQSYRVDWTESIIRTGIPPANPLYSYQHPVTMHNYYFWYVVCAAVAQTSHLPVRVVLAAGSVWVGFVLAALTGLYLKHFLVVGGRLRRQFLLSMSLFAVTGLDICVILWNMLYLHHPPPPDLEAWSKDAIVSWLHTLLWAPHHIASMVCCMFAFLLAWMGGKDGAHSRGASV